MEILYMVKDKESFHQKLESIQYNAALAITGAIRGTFREKLYQELGLESLQKQVGIENGATFLKRVKVNFHVIFPKYFLVLEDDVTQEMLITFAVSIANTSFSESHFPINFN